MESQSSDNSGWQEAAAVDAADAVAPASTSCRSTEQTLPTLQHAMKPRPLYSPHQNPFNMAMLFQNFNTKHETENKANAATSSGAADR